MRPDLDMDYMSNWLEEFDLHDRLQRIEDGVIEAGLLNGKITRQAPQAKAKDRDSGWEL